MNHYPLAYFITWTTYGTWLPGDRRGWVAKGEGRVIHSGDTERERQAKSIMAETVVMLDAARRAIVDEVIVNHCEFRGWTLHSRNVRTNHVHVVVSAPREPEVVREQLKAWCARRLSEDAGFLGRSKNGHRRWWTEGGDIEFIDNEAELESAISYVRDGQ